MLCSLLIPPPWVRLCWQSSEIMEHHNWESRTTTFQPELPCVAQVVLFCKIQDAGFHSFVCSGTEMRDHFHSCGICRHIHCQNLFPSSYVACCSVCSAIRCALSPDCQRPKTVTVTSLVSKAWDVTLGFKLTDKWPDLINQTIEPSLGPWWQNSESPGVYWVLESLLLTFIGVRVTCRCFAQLFSDFMGHLLCSWTHAGWSDNVLRWKCWSFTSLYVRFEAADFQPAKLSVNILECCLSRMTSTCQTSAELNCVQEALSVLRGHECPVGGTSGVTALSRIAVFFSSEELAEAGRECHTSRNNPSLYFPSNRSTFPSSLLLFACTRTCTDSHAPPGFGCRSSASVRFEKQFTSSPSNCATSSSEVILACFFAVASPQCFQSPPR